MDTTRWIIAEAWIANGLRLQWAHRYSNNRPMTADGWQEEIDTKNPQLYRYAGQGIWEVWPADSDINRQAGRDTAPMLTLSTMQHELAHWLTSTTEQRYEQNFGLKDGDISREEHALNAERVIDAIVAAAGRITTLALEKRL